MLRVEIQITGKMTDKIKQIQENTVIKRIQMKKDMLWHIFSVQIFIYFLITQACKDFAMLAFMKRQIFIMRIYALRDWLDICIWKTNGIIIIKSSWCIKSRKSLRQCNAVLKRPVECAEKMYHKYKNKNENKSL